MGDFPQFQRLAMELQDMIWGFALPSGTRMHFLFGYEDQRYSPSRHRSAYRVGKFLNFDEYAATLRISQVNRTARAVANQRTTRIPKPLRLFDQALTGPAGIIDLTNDIVCCGHADNVGGRSAILPKVPSLREARKVAFLLPGSPGIVESWRTETRLEGLEGRHVLESFGMDMGMLFRPFPRLETVFLIVTRAQLEADDDGFGRAGSHERAITTPDAAVEDGVDDDTEQTPAPQNTQSNSITAASSEYAEVPAVSMAGNLDQGVRTWLAPYRPNDLHYDVMHTLRTEALALPGILANPVSQLRSREQTDRVQFKIISLRVLRPGGGTGIQH